MSKFEDDLARGCLPTGEPLECLYGMGWWTEIPEEEPEPEPDPVDLHIAELEARIAELEAENERLSQLLHDEMSQLEIATDLGNKRWIALNEIYEKSEKHSAWWCKRKAQEGLGIK